ncbi:MAG TPA: SdrD B-like domain-containing protein [Armatimonadota bacterium]|nr:SdrD B-like domain-containing protein [Armatimonadota bacterium]
MKRVAFLILLVTSVLLVCSMATAQVPGAIWTTDEFGTVNRNIYYAKCDVWLNGGPINQNAPGLPDGDYYYQVTDPSGSELLSTEDISLRTVLVVGGWFDEVVQLCPYNDTPNPGGEYKVWLTSVADYDPGNILGAFGFVPAFSKTDNFKVKQPGGPPPPPPIGAIGGFKYYDVNVNGVLDLLTDIPIEGWLIELYEGSIDPANLVASVFTDPTGAYRFEDLQAGTYIIREVMPLGNWVQTGPKDSSTDLDPLPNVVVTALGGVYTVELLTNDAVTSDVNFGNVCLGAGGGKTLGFWANKNGQKIINDNWSTISGSGILSCSILQGLPGTNLIAPYLSKSQIKSFLLSANAVDMRYMLAAQWLAMEFNILVGDVDPDSLVYTGSGFETIGNICALVCSIGAGWDRATQEMYKDILDDANNNKNFVQPGPCLPIVYP